MGKEMGIVDALKGIELVSGRAKAVYADFILAGPLNLWFKKLITNPEPRYIIITNRENGEKLKDALCINSKILYWGDEWENITGKLVRCLLYDRYIVELLVDPMLGDSSSAYRAKSLARASNIVYIGDYLVRLAPLSFEVALQSTLNTQQSRVN